MSHVILDDGAVAVHLPFFQRRTLSRNRNVQSVRGAYSPGFTLLGDMQVEPLQVEISGTIFESDEATFKERKALVYSAIKRNPQWLKVGDRQLLIGGLVSDVEEEEDPLRRNASKFQFVVQGLKPFWEAQSPTVIVKPLPMGNSLITVNNPGDLPVWPVVRITGNDINKFGIVTRVRSFAWEGETLGVSDLVIDSFDGTIRLGGQNVITTVKDYSLFPISQTGESVMGLYVNAPGEVSISFRAAYE